MANLLYQKLFVCLFEAENPVEHVLITTSKPQEDNIAGFLQEPAQQIETFEIDNTSQSEVLFMLKK